jgi:hydroxyacylglutathione hydrolase
VGIRWVVGSRDHRRARIDTEEDEDVLVAGFPAGAFQTNCYVVAPDEGGPAVVVDPGQDAEEPLRKVLAERRLTPVAVLLTHGHLDHMWSVTPVCDGDDIPAWIHPEDRGMLADPLGSVGPMGAQLAAMYPGLEFREPRKVETLTDGAEVDLAGVTFTVDHTPGHTRGSVTFTTPYLGPEDVPAVLFSGDVLFAGSIGRTDLPGGDHPAMLHTLATKILPMRDEIVVLPGHGGQTTIGREKATNPYLQDLETVK